MLKRRILLWVMAAVCIALAVYLSASAISVYREGSVRRDQDPLADIYTPEITAAKLRDAAPLFVAFFALLVTIHITGIKDKNGERCLKSPRYGPAMSGTNVARISEASGRKIFTVRMIFLILAVLLLVLGVLNGSAMDVFSKAVTVCTECVGLG